MLFQVAAISAQASETKRTSNENSLNPSNWKSFSMVAVVSATEDLLDFILSEKGLKVQVCLMRDILGAADTFLDQQLVSRFDEDSKVCLYVYTYVSVQFWYGAQ